MPDVELVLQFAAALGVIAAIVTVLASATSVGGHLGAQAAALRTPVGLANAAVVIVGVAIRDWLVAATAAAAAAVGLIGSLPVGWPRRCPRSASPGVRLTTANVLVDNERFGELLEHLLAEEPDVLLLQEVTPEHAAVLEVHVRSRPELFVHADPRPGYAGWATISRFDVRAQGAIEIGDWPISWCVLDHPDTPVRIVNVHAPAPQTRADHDGWERYLGALAEFADGSLPTILAGDFNATSDHRRFRRLVDAGFTDAFHRVGQGWGATWPDSRFALPMLRLDHVLVDERLMATDLRSVSLPGSDHRGLVSVIRSASECPRS